MVLLSILAFRCLPTWSHDENVDCPHLYHVIMGLYTLIVGVLKYFLFWGFVRLDFYALLPFSYGAFVHFGFSLSADMIAWRECWLSTPVSCDHGIVHLDCWSIKIFSLLWVLSAFLVILWGFCPMVLLSILAFHCLPKWSQDENADCPHLYHVIMGLYTLIVGVLNILSFGGFVRCDFYPNLGLLSYGAFAIFSFWGFVGFACYPLGLLSYGAFVHFGFSLSAHLITCLECWLSTPVSCDHGIVHLDCWSIKTFSLLGLLSVLIFILWAFCPMVLLSILALLCLPTWSHDENVDCPHLYHVIIWSYTLIVGVLNYFLFWGFCRLCLLSFGAFVLWCFCPFWLFVVCLNDHMSRMLIVHTCIMWLWDCTPWLLEY